MTHACWLPSLPWKELVARGAVVYVAVLALLRLSGKRQVGQMGAGDLVAVLLISNAVQNSMTGGDESILGGLLLAAVIVGMSVVAAHLSYRSKRWEALLEGRPTLLVHHGEVLDRNLQKELLSHAELRTLLRKQGIHHLHEIAQAVLEADGSISVIHKSEASAPS